MCVMTDHYSKSVDALVELDDIRSELERLYAVPRNAPASPGLPRQRPAAVQAKLNRLHSRQGMLLKLAEVHALLSVRQAIQDAATPETAITYRAHLVGGRS